MPNEAAATRVVLGGSERSGPANAQDVAPAVVGVFGLDTRPVARRR